MTFVHRYLFHAMWLSWVGYWWAASFNVKTAARREPLLSRVSHLAPLALGVFLLFPQTSPIEALGERFMPAAVWPFWVGAVLTLAGLLFSVWARVHIGRNWSGTITSRKTTT